MKPPPRELADGLAVLHVRSAADETWAEQRSSLFAETDAALPIGIVCLENALVTPRGFVIHADSLIWDTTYINHAWMSGHGSSALPDVFNANRLWAYDPLKATIALSPPTDARVIEEPCFLFNSENGMGNFAHFVHDTLLQVPTYLEAARGRSLAPLFVGKGFRFEPARRLLAACLGGREGEWFETGGKFVRVRRLFVPTPHVDFDRQLVSVPAARRMRALVGATLGAAPKGPPRHLYVSRADASGLRHEVGIANQAAFSRLLAELGFAEVIASTLSADLYFETFQNARTIIGLHGAGLMNVILSSEGRLIELATPGVGGTGLTMVAAAAGYPCARIMHDDASAITVDLDAVREAFGRLDA